MFDLYSSATFGWKWPLDVGLTVRKTLVCCVGKGLYLELNLQWWWCRGRVVGYGYWGPGFDSHRFFCFSFRDIGLFCLSCTSCYSTPILLSFLFFFFSPLSLSAGCTKYYLYLCSLSIWDCWNQSSIRNCCFEVQWNRKKNLRPVFWGYFSSIFPRKMFYNNSHAPGFDPWILRL